MKLAELLSGTAPPANSANRANPACVLNEISKISNISSLPGAETSEAIEERAAILEFDANQPRPDAERGAVQLVQCRNCQHYTPDNVNAADGIGTCAVGAWPQSRGTGSARPMPPYPGAVRTCTQYVDTRPMPDKLRARFRVTCVRLQIDPAPVLEQFDRWHYTGPDLREMDGWPDATIEAHCRLLVKEQAGGTMP
ncbi:MAG: hypothetical protein EPN61_00225, partial [Burkholderiaceae bacterium]